MNQYTNQHTHTLEIVDGAIKVTALPQIALACELSRYGQRLIEIAGSISAYHAMGKPPSDLDLREASDAAAAAMLAISHYHVGK